MATISIAVGGVTVTRAVEDSQATAVLNLYYAAVYQYREGDPPSPTARQRLQVCLDEVVDHIVQTARGQRRRELRAVNEDAEKAEAGGIGL